LKFFLFLGMQISCRINELQFAIIICFNYQMVIAMTGYKRPLKSMERCLKLWGKFHEKYEKNYTFSERYLERLI